MAKDSDTLKKARIRISKYCAFTERSPKQITNKLNEYGLNAKEASEILLDLIDNNFVNEIRFAKAFAHDKNKFNKWGRIKIANELRFKHQLSEETIQSGLQHIDTNEYAAVARDLMTRKLARFEPSVQPNIKRKKCLNYMNGKGFETDFVMEMLGSLMSDMNK